VSEVKCLILAAGNGGRLAQICDSKPLLQVAGLPLIERTIATAQQAGISEFYVVTGYSAEGVESFLAELSLRRSVKITSIRNADWQLGNGASLLSARRELDGPFVMMMADHIVDETIVKQIVLEPVDDGAVVLAVDFRVNGNRLVDPGDVTKVQTTDHHVTDIGKDIEEYDAYDTGVFLCSPSIFDAAEESARDGDFSVTGAIRRMADDGRVRILDVEEGYWVDVDTPTDARNAKAVLYGNLCKPADGFISRTINRRISTKITTPLLLKLWKRVTPNQVSVLSFMVAVLASASFFLALPVLGGALIQLTSVLDGSDGEIARLKKLQSSFGNFFDAVLDRYSDSLIIFGMFFYALNSSRIEGFLGLDPTSLIVVASAVALSSSMLVSYTSAKSIVDFGYTYGGRLTAAGTGRDLRLFVLTLGGIGVLIHPVSVLIALSTVAVLATGILLWRLRISWRFSRDSNPLLGMRLKAVIFDFDGTIVDTMPFLTELAVGLIIENYGISREKALAGYRATTGLDFGSQIERMFPGDPKNLEVVAAMEVSKTEGIFGHALFDEVIPALKFFEASSVKRFICSSTREEIVRDYVKRTGIDGLLDGSFGYRKGFTKGRQIDFVLAEHGLDRSEVLFVGDSLADAQFVVDNGVRFIGIRRLFSREEFREQGLFSVGGLADVAQLWSSSKGLIQFTEVAGAPVRA